MTMKVMSGQVQIIENIENSNKNILHLKGKLATKIRQDTYARGYNGRVPITND